MEAKHKRRMVILLSQAVLLVLTLALYLIFRRNRLFIDLWDGRNGLLSLVFIGALAGLGIRLTSTLAGKIWPRFQDNMEDTVIKTLHDIDLLDLILIAILPAIAEELFFRGFLQPYVGIWIGALIFSFLHWGGVKELWAHGLHAFLVGLFFGWLYSVSGSLLTTMIAHFTNNLLAGLYIQKKISF